MINILDLHVNKSDAAAAAALRCPLIILDAGVFIVIDQIATAAATEPAAAAASMYETTVAAVTGRFGWAVGRLKANCCRRTKN